MVTDVPVTRPSYEMVGCFCDNYCGNHLDRSTTRAISGSITFYHPPLPVVVKCFEKSIAAGYSYFAVQNRNECFTSKNAGSTYDMFGETSGCRDGRGGKWRNSVYRITGIECYQFSGWWRYDLNNAKTRASTTVKVGWRTLRWRVTNFIVKVLMKPDNFVSMGRQIALGFFLMYK